MPAIPQTSQLSSAGHRLGQMIGDWWETSVILPVLKEVADELDLFVDNRAINRECRDEKIQWKDYGGNVVDYDYVIELGGSTTALGAPVAFIESFWRRGSRHSKDKARDDTNKLLPMRETYPTARFLAIAACGEFTEPAREYVRSRGVELFFVSKENIVKSFSRLNLNIDYQDSLPEPDKKIIVDEFSREFTENKKEEVTKKLYEVAGKNTFTSFKSKIKSALSATPQEITVSLLKKSTPMFFDNIHKAGEFFEKASPWAPGEDSLVGCEYRVIFSDGSEFKRTTSDLADAKAINFDLIRLVDHLQGLSRT